MCQCRKTFHWHETIRWQVRSWRLGFLILASGILTPWIRMIVLVYTSIYFTYIYKYIYLYILVYTCIYKYMPKRYCIYRYIHLLAIETFSRPGHNFMMFQYHLMHIQCSAWHIVRYKVKKHRIMGVYTDLKECYFQNRIY